MPNIEYYPDKRGQGKTGLYTGSQVVTVANRLGDATGVVGIFDYLGKNRGRSTRVNPCYYINTNNGIYNDVVATPSIARTVRMQGLGNGTTDPIGWTDGNLTANPSTGLVNSALPDDGLMLDFCAGWASGSTINGVVKSNMCTVQIENVAFRCYSIANGVSFNFLLEGSNNGAHWTRLLTMDQTLNFAAGTTYTYAVNSSKFYRFIRFMPGSTVNGSVSSSFFSEFEFGGKIKFIDS